MLVAIDRLRDRDRIYGDRFRRMLEILGVEEVVTTARSPWQNAYAERLVGSLRRECLDHVVILGEIHLLRILAGYFEYYNKARCHLSLVGDAPEPGPAQGPTLGSVVELPEVGGVHHRYDDEEDGSDDDAEAPPTSPAPRQVRDLDCDGRADRVALHLRPVLFLE